MIQPEILKKQFVQKFGESQSDLTCYFSPGRINLIGEHIDYNGGSVLPATISLGITAVVRKKEEAVLRIYSGDFNEEIKIDLAFHLPTTHDGNVQWKDNKTSTTNEG